MKTLLLTFFIVLLATPALLPAPIIVTLPNTESNRQLLTTIPHDPVSEHPRKDFLEVIVDDSSLLAFSAIRNTIQTTQISFAGIDDYPDNDENYAAMLDLATRFPDIAQLSIIGYSQRQNKPIYMLKISDNAATKEDEPVVWIDGMHHAREPATMVCAMTIAAYLCENYGTNVHATSFVNNLEIYIVPILNPEGYDYFIATINGSWWRKNLRDNNSNDTIDLYDGVDLNRNYNSGWNFNTSGSSDPTSLVYKGPHVWSESEVKAKRDQVLSIRPLAALTYHQYGQIIFYSNGVNNHSVGESSLITSIAQSIAVSIPKLSSGTYDIGGGYENEPMSYYWMYQSAGVFEYLIETATSFLPDYTTAQTVANQNLNGAITLFNRCINGPGIQGVIYDSEGNPISARVEILQYKNDDLGARVSDSTFGRFRRFTTNGTFSIDVSAPGHKTKRITGISVNNAWVTVDVYLEAGSDEPVVVPNTISAFPNPFSRSVTIECEYTGFESAQVKIFNAKGKMVFAADGVYSNGVHLSYMWNGTDDKGRRLPSGMYYCSMTVGSKEYVKKIVLLR